MEPTTRSGKAKKLKSKQRACSEVSVNRKQSAESVDAVLEKKRKATAGRIYRKGSF